METSMKVQRLRAKKFNTTNRSDVAKPISTQQKLKKLKIVLSKNVRDYCENTSVHGLKYVVNKNLYPFERLFFAISFICVVIGTVYFVAKIYEKWNYTPMLVSINPKLWRITEEPFPAVTICNLNQAYKAKAEQFSVYSLEHTILQMICKLDVNVTIAEAITVTDWNNLRNFIYEISQPCFNMLLQCKYGSTFFNCSEIFRPIITDNGLCCTFNMVHTKFMYREIVIKASSAQNYRYPIGYEAIDWSTENGFPADLPKKFIPMKALGTGESQGLSLILDVERDEYYCSSSDGIGFKILLHNPLEAPNMREIGLLLAPGRETQINIYAEKVESEQYVRSVSKASRKCLFEDEQILKIYKKYTQRNCIEECSVFAWLGICGCLPYFKPMPYGNETICDMLDSTCVERIRIRTMLYDKAGKSCANICIPGCNDINYLPSFTSAPLIQTGFPTQSEVAKNISNGYLKKNLAVVKIYFKDITYGGAKNSDFIRAPDFLSNIGGIIGLFFGVSFISLAELIFYCIWRPVRMLVATRKSGNARSAKLRKSKSIRLLFTKQSIHNIDTLQQRNSYNQNFPQRSKAWEAMAVKQDTPWNEIKSSKLAWQPGMEYTP